MHVLPIFQSSRWFAVLKSHIMFVASQGVFILMTYIELQIGMDDSWQMYSTFVVHDVLQFWDEKPWSYTPLPKSFLYSWRKLTNLVFPFVDFSLDCGDEKDSLEEIGSPYQHDPAASKCSVAPLCLADRSLVMSDWILKLKRIASLRQNTAASADARCEMPVQVWVIDKHKQVHCKLPCIK